MTNKKVFAENLYAVQKFLSEVDDSITHISIAYTGAIVIYFARDVSKADIERRLEEYGLTEYKFSGYERNVFIYRKEQ